MSTLISVETNIAAPPEKVWAAWTRPEHIVRWNAASDDWHTPTARNDLRVGGRFNYRMEARDGSVGFDFEGEYLEIVPPRRIAFSLGDDRNVTVEFVAAGDSTKVIESFVAESTEAIEMQRAGWQSILDNFRKHVETLG